MIDKRRKEIYVFYDKEKMIEMYQTFKSEIQPDEIEYAKTMKLEDYDKVIDDMFKDETFIYEIDDIVYKLEMEILQTIDDLVFNYVNEKLSQRNT
jgi:hypothetical protein